MKRNMLVVSLLCVLLASQFLNWGCTDKYEPITASGSSCVHCHLNADLLREVADPLPPSDGEAGEG